MALKIASCLTNALKRLKFCNNTNLKTLIQSCMTEDRNSIYELNRYETVPLCFQEYGEYKFSKVPIVIMHGMLGSKRNWNSLSKIICEKTERKVYNLDARNHGDSPHTLQMNYFYMAADVLNLLKQNHVYKCTLIGHSMGGRVMMLLALLHPNLVRDLFVVDVSPIYRSHRSDKIKHVLNILSEKKFDNMATTLTEARKMNLDEAKFILMSLVQNNGSFQWKFNVYALLSCIEELYQFPICREYQFFGKVLFIGGAKSDYIRPSDHDEIKKLFPNADFKYIDNAGHMVHVEKQQDFLKLIIPQLTDRSIQ